MLGVEDQVEGMDRVRGVAPAGAGDVGVTRPSVQADDGVTQGGHDLGCVADADLGTVLVKGHIAHPSLHLEVGQPGVHRR